MIQISTKSQDETTYDLSTDPVESLARQLVAEDQHYSHRFRDISFHHVDGVLTLRGRLPSFYMKQVLQSLLREVGGVERLDNQTFVCQKQD